MEDDRMGQSHGNKGSLYAQSNVKGGQDKSDQGDKLQQQEAQCRREATTNDKLPEADLQLVHALRELLECACRDNEIFSRHHYEEIMNPSSPNVCWRYLLHCNAQVEQALELAKSVLVWRKDNRVDHLEPSSMLKDIWLRMPIGFVGRTRDGHELMYAIGKNFRKPQEPARQMIKDFMTHLLFNWEQRHTHDLEQVVLIFDVTGTSLRNVDLDMANWFLTKIDYVPARLRAIYFVGVPLMLRPIFKLVISWLPSKFSNIVSCGSYDELVRANVTDDNLPEEVGGRADNKWRLAPLEAPWAHESDSHEVRDLLEKVCYACSFNALQGHIDRVYKMQSDYEKSLKG